jgi:hypothetical protein
LGERAGIKLRAQRALHGWIIYFKHCEDSHHRGG